MAVHRIVRAGAPRAGVDGAGVGIHTVRVAGELTNETGTVQVFGNGELFATITFTETSLTVVNANGDPLSDREEQVLREIMDFVDEVFDVWEDLFAPVEFLFNV